MSSKVLIVDDEVGIRRFLRVSLTGAGHRVLEAADGIEALQLISQERPELVVLDLGLPGIGGVDVIRQVREWSDLPIIVLSVRDREKDKVEALDAGADDYLTKPFGLAELMARVRTALRRTLRRQDGSSVFQVGELRVDLEARLVCLKEKELSLTPTEYELLKVLVRNAGRVLTHHQIMERVWGDSEDRDPHMLRVNISNLRKKLEPDPVRPRYIVTEPGVGYRLRGDQ
jgi:two-component system KDP operon response regulator KdpE